MQCYAALKSLSRAFDSAMPDPMMTFAARGVAMAGLEILDCQIPTSGSTTVADPESQKFRKVPRPDRREHTQTDIPDSPERWLALGDRRDGCGCRQPI